jgi:hypothetical protein
MTFTKVQGLLVQEPIFSSVCYDLYVFCLWSVGLVGLLVALLVWTCSDLLQESSLSSIGWVEQFVIDYPFTSLVLCFLLFCQLALLPSTLNQKNDIWTGTSTHMVRHGRRMTHFFILSQQLNQIVELWPAETCISDCYILCFIELFSFWGLCL